MIDATLRQIAALTGGEVSPGDEDVVVSGPATIDSRAVEAGALFVAIQGDRVDGLDFVPQAVEAGATAVLTSRAIAAPHVLVADPVAALGALAGWVVARLTVEHGLVVAAITGSQGKTSAKDILAKVLAGDAETISARGSFNNELGVPLTALRATPTTRYLVLEMGARGIGHIADLCAIAPPSIALVLNVGHAHIGEFGSREAIAQAKSEIIEALRPSGTAVLNADDPAVAAMAQRTEARIVTFGRTADVALGEIEVLPDGTTAFELDIAGESRPVRLQLIGEHQAVNATAAAAVAYAAGVGIETIVTALDGVQSLSSMRMERTVRADGLVVINDAYNANPASMAAALRALAQLHTTGGRYAVLGEMLELGESAEREHRAVGTLVAELGIDVLVTVGAGGSAIAEGAVEAGGAVEIVRLSTTEEAGSVLGTRVRPGDVVLTKASRAIGLERVAAVLLES